NVLDVGSSAEWHATIAYTPQQYVVGGTLASKVSPYGHLDSALLTVQARVARAGESCGTAANWPETTRFDRLQKSSWWNGYVITTSLSVRLGDALPRFDEGWVYGDLHYHSQGTDNEGESAYSYRSTIQAMRAMGLDFIFATDHASDSGQVTDIDEIYLDK